MSHLAITWVGSGGIDIRLRDRRGWSGWTAVHGCQAGPDGASPSSGAMLVAPGAVEYEVAWAGDVGQVRLVELNTVDGPVWTSAAALGTFPMNGTDPGAAQATPVRYLSRAAWGADESLRFYPDGSESWPPAYYPVQTLTVHHTAGVNDDPDPAATVRAIYYFHAVTLDWGDIGYHLLIDERGTVYEGRWSGGDRVPIFGGPPGPDGLAQMVTGGHAFGYNVGNIGISLLGTFTDQQPVPAARRSLTMVLAALARLRRLDPTGMTDYANPVNGNTAHVHTISGHRDWNATECPGNAFYPQLPSLRDEVARLTCHH